jgi:high affinity sulfate transporter 1
VQAKSPNPTLKSFVPILDWLPKYDKAWLRGDIIAAITVWALLVPEAMAYAGIAGMPPETGLYAAPLALLGYAIFGTSRQLNVGPSSTVAALSFTVVSGIAVAGSDEFIALSITLAILTGLLLVIAGLLKMGVFADFLSKPVLGGFVIGLAISIAVGQLDKLLGFEARTMNFVPDILLIFQDVDQTNLPTLVVGLVSLGLLFFIDRFFPKLPGAITVLILAIIVSALLDLEALGVHVVGDIPAGLPPFGLPSGITPGDIFDLLPGALAIALVGFAESVAAARSYATKYRYEINANQEMIALGVANLGAGMSNGFVVDGSLSKTAASDEAGAKSQMVSIIVAGMVLITVVALTPLFRTLPEATLGAIVIHAVWHLIKLTKLRRYYRIRQLDFWAAMTAMVGVLLLGILSGLLLAVTISLLGLLIRAKQANMAILGKLPGESVFQSVENHPEAETYPGLIIFRFDEQLFFANAPNFRDAVLAAVAADPSARWVLVDAGSINEIDVTGLDMLTELRDELAQDNIELRFARMKAHVREYVRRANLEESIGAEHFYLSVQAGVEAYMAEQASSSVAARGQ